MEGNEMKRIEWNGKIKEKNGKKMKGKLKKCRRKRKGRKVKRKDGNNLYTLQD
jgi:arginyl-tRNA synthetase